MLEITDRKQVETAVENWEARLKSLYAQVAEYCKDHRLPKLHPPLQLLRGEILQNQEMPLEQFDVRPKMLPTLAVLYGRSRVSFVPVGIWMVGANGRLNVTTNRHQYILKDMAEDGSGSPNWQIVTSRLAAKHREFDFDVFKDLLEGRELD